MANIDNRVDNLAANGVEREVTQTTVANDNVAQTRTQVADPVAESDHKKNVAARVIWFIAGVIITLLTLRFLFVLLGASTASGFVNFLYGITAPLAAPFFGIFGYTFANGQSRFEIGTLVAILIYALIAWGLAKLLTLTSRTA